MNDHKSRCAEKFPRKKLASIGLLGKGSSWKIAVRHPQANDQAIKKPPRGWLFNPAVGKFQNSLEISQSEIFKFTQLLESK
jgi:hypothetical protein